MTNAVESLPTIPSGARAWPLSLAAYHALGDLGLIPEESELLYGQIFQKMSKSPLHSSLVRRLVRLLKLSIPSGLFLDTEQPISCADSEPEPDIAVIRGSEDDFWKQHPHTAELAVEICVTSHDYDRSKLRAYAAANVTECWLVLGPEKQVEVYRQPREGQYTQQMDLGINDTLTCAVLPGFSLPLKLLFAA